MENDTNEPELNYGKQKITISEYLKLEKDSSQKHEFFNGEVFALAGASLKHNKLFSNLFGELWHKLKGNKCQPYGSELRIHIPQNSLFTYPDISIICGDLISSEEDDDTAVSPTVIIEILSESTKNYDRGSKFKL